MCNSWSCTKSQERSSGRFWALWLCRTATKTASDKVSERQLNQFSKTCRHPLLLWARLGWSIQDFTLRNNHFAKIVQSCHWASRGRNHKTNKFHGTEESLCRAAVNGKISFKQKLREHMQWLLWESLNAGHRAAIVNIIKKDKGNSLQKKGSQDSGRRIVTFHNTLIYLSPQQKRRRRRRRRERPGPYDNNGWLNTDNHYVSFNLSSLVAYSQNR